MNIEKDFEEFYKELLLKNKSNFDEIEEQRKKAIIERKNNKIAIYIIELILLIIAVLSFKFFGFQEGTEETNEIIFLFCAMGSLAFPAIIAIKSRKFLHKYEKTYKEKVINSLIKLQYPTMNYYSNGNIDYDDYNNLEVEHCNSFYSSNVIKGIYKNNEVTIAKIISTYSTIDYSTSKTKKYETFEGVFLKSSLPQNTRINLYAKCKKQLKDKIFNAFVGDINQVSKSENTEANLKKNYNVIDNEQLKDIFNLYSSDINCSILDSKMINILKEIYNVQKFEFAIKENNIYMRFWVDGLFSAPPLIKEVYDKEIIYKNYKILYLMFYLLVNLQERI